MPWINLQWGEFVSSWEICGGSDVKRQMAEATNCPDPPRIWPLVHTCAHLQLSSMLLHCWQQPMEGVNVHQVIQQHTLPRNLDSVAELLCQWEEHEGTVDKGAT